MPLEFDGTSGGRAEIVIENKRKLPRFGRDGKQETVGGANALDRGHAHRIACRANSQYIACGHRPITGECGVTETESLPALAQHGYLIPLSGEPEFRF